jgi:hypothetical protein
MNNTQVDIVAGISAGIVASTISHPLDTIKVRIQLNKTEAPLTIRKCVSEVYLREGVSGSN